MSLDEHTIDEDKLPEDDIEEEDDSLEEDEEEEGEREKSGDNAEEGDGHESEELESKKERRRKWLGRLGTGFSLCILVLSGYVLTRTVSGLHWSELRAALAATSMEQIVAACVLTACSYLALTGYDAVALRQLRVAVPYRTTALGSFTSFAISFTLGFPLITAGTVRYWIYSRVGLTAAKVASLTVIAGLTF